MKCPASRLQVSPPHLGLMLRKGTTSLQKIWCASCSTHRYVPSKTGNSAVTSLMLSKKWQWSWQEVFDQLLWNWHLASSPLISHKLEPERLHWTSVESQTTDDITCLFNCRKSCYLQRHDSAYAIILVRWFLWRWVHSLQQSVHRFIVVYPLWHCSERCEPVYRKEEADKSDCTSVSNLYSFSMQTSYRLRGEMFLLLCWFGIIKTYFLQKKSGNIAETKRLYRSYKARSTSCQSFQQHLYCLHQPFFSMY